MIGEIYVASPAEAVYQVAKASPSDAEERFGPGGEMPAGLAGDVTGEVEPPETEAVENGPGIESEGKLESGSETETGELVGDEIENGSGIGPGDGSGNGSGTKPGDGSGEGSGTKRCV